LRYRIRRFGPHSTAATVAILYFILAVIFVPIVYFASQANANPKGKLPAIILILGPVCYALFGYIMTVIMCWLYNVIASWTGGVAMTLEADEAAA
jgi:ABC-type multidrug transport system permease subunit